MTTQDKISEKMFDFMDAVNELNKQINAEVNHGSELTAENRKDFMDFFGTRLNKVNQEWQNLKTNIQNL